MVSAAQWLYGFLRQRLLNYGLHLDISIISFMCNGVISILHPQYCTCSSSIITLALNQFNKILCGLEDLVAVYQGFNPNWQLLKTWKENSLTALASQLLHQKIGCQLFSFVSSFPLQYQNVHIFRYSKQVFKSSLFAFS